MFYYFIILSVVLATSHHKHGSIEYNQVTVVACVQTVQDIKVRIMVLYVPNVPQVEHDFEYKFS